MTEWQVYGLKDPTTGVVRYVGWTVNLKRRLRDHLKPSQLLKFNTHKVKWLRSLVTRGLIPEVQVLESGSGSGWQESERKWISYFKAAGNLTNHTDGGDGTPGRHPSVETRKRWSELRKGRAPSTLSIQRTIELTKGKSRPRHIMEPMWAANRGTPKSAEHRAALSKSKTGKKMNFTKEQRQAAAIRMLEARKFLKRTTL